MTPDLQCRDLDEMLAVFDGRCIPLHLSAGRGLDQSFIHVETELDGIDCGIDGDLDLDGSADLFVILRRQDRDVRREVIGPLIRGIVRRILEASGETGCNYKYENEHSDEVPDHECTVPWLTGTLNKDSDIIF